MNWRFPQSHHFKNLDLGSDISHFIILGWVVTNACQQLRVFRSSLWMNKMGIKGLQPKCQLVKPNHYAGIYMAEKTQFDGNEITYFHTRDLCTSTVLIPLKSSSFQQGYLLLFTFWVLQIASELWANFCCTCWSHYASRKAKRRKETALRKDSLWPFSLSLKVKHWFN